MSSNENNSRSQSQTRVRHGFFPIVVGENVDVAQSGAIAFAAGNDIHLSQGGGNILLAGNKIIIEKGGGNFLASGSGVSIEQGGAGVVVAPEVRFANSFVGFALGRSVEVSDDSRLLIGSRQAAILGASLAATAVMVRILFRNLGRKKGPSN